MGVWCVFSMCLGFHVFGVSCVCFSAALWIFVLFCSVNKKERTEIKKERKGDKKKTERKKER